MKKRYLYALLFGIPGFFAAGIISLLAFGALIGILWLFVFGDNPWPASPDAVLSIVLVLTFLSLWTGSIITGYALGKKLESDPALNRIHVLISAGLTLLFILFILLQQLSVGNLGPKSEAHSVRSSVLKRDIPPAERPRGIRAIAAASVSTTLGMKP